MTVTSPSLVLNGLTPNQSDPLVEAAVERLCEQGCRDVYQVIDKLAAGQVPTVLAGLDAERCAEVLTDLRAIMAVYAENGSACLVGDQ